MFRLLCCAIVTIFLPWVAYSQGNKTYSNGAQVERVFARVVVQGNARFDDRDIFATADLRAGEAYTENDLISALEALEFTGEFKSVRIFSQGSVLTIQVQEEPQFSGGLTFGLGYESDTGLIGTFGLQLDDALGNGSSIRSKLSLSGEFSEASGSVSNLNFWGTGRAGGVRAAYADYRYDDTLFDYSFASLSPYLSFDLGAAGQGEVRATALWTSIDDVDANASPIIQAEDGEQLSFGPGVSYLVGSSGEALGNWALRVDQDAFLGNISFSRTELRLSGQIPFVGRTRLRSRLEIGGVVGLDGEDPTAANRYTLGGTAMRGFARGGISPRDVCLGCGPGATDLATDLGGNYYAVIRNELVFPPFGNGNLIEPFLFSDFGTVWSVETDTAPAGLLIDGADIRSSAGIGFSIETPLGQLSATYAPFIDGERFDDEAEFGIGLSGRF